MLENFDLHTNLVILFRIILAVVLSFAPGVERELTGKFAGLRTHILVCLGACVFTILSIYGFNMYAPDGSVATQNDPARIAAQVITGIGFIGAGTVMRNGGNVFGITTAATLWMCAAIGMCCGCGEYIVAIIASLATLLVLVSIRRLEKNFLSKRKLFYTLYEITLSASIDECDNIQTIIQKDFHKIFKFNKKLVNNDQLKISTIISTKKSLKEINELFKAIANINSIEIREHYE